MYISERITMCSTVQSACPVHATLLLQTDTEKRDAWTQENLRKNVILESVFAYVSVCFTLTRCN